jgi:hypothetical protein
MHLLLLSFVFGVRAGSLLASVFSDSMVLQRGVVNAIWGYTSARREKLHKQIEEGQKQVQKLRAEIGATQQAEAEAGGGNT